MTDPALISALAEALARRIAAQHQATCGSCHWLACVLATCYADVELLREATAPEHRWPDDQTAAETRHPKLPNQTGTTVDWAGTKPL